MTPPRSPQNSRIYSETIRRVEPICETPDPCVTVHRLVEDPITRSSYVEETRECFETFHRVPDTRLFDRLPPEIRQRLAELNHRHETLQRPPQSTPRPQRTPSQPPPAAPRPQPQPHPSAPPSSQSSSASSVAGAIVVGVLGGIIGGGAGRLASRAAMSAVRAARRLLP